jgi:DNA repair photolyase
VRLSDWQRHFDNLQKKRTLRHVQVNISGAASDRELHDRNESGAETQAAAWA